MIWFSKKKKKSLYDFCFIFSSLNDFDFSLFSFLFYYFSRLSLFSTTSIHIISYWCLLLDVVAIRLKTVTEGLISVTIFVLSTFKLPIADYKSYLYNSISYK